MFIAALFIIAKASQATKIIFGRRANKTVIHPGNGILIPDRKSNELSRQDIGVEEP